MAKQNVKTRVEQLSAEVKKLQIAMKDFASSGEGANKSFDELSKRFEQLKKTADGLPSSINKSFGQTKNLKTYNASLSTLIASMGKLESIEKKLSAAQVEARKLEQKNLRASIKENNARNSERLKSHLATQKKLKARRAARTKEIAREEKSRQKLINRIQVSLFKKEVSEFKKKEKAKTAALKQEAKKREAEAAKEARDKDFGGGLRGQYTQRSVGSAVGNLTKYLGLYRLLEGAQRVFSELTIGAVRQSINFQAELARLSAVAGVASEDLSMLAQSALDTAGATKFTAEQVVSMQVELSKLGFTAQEVADATQAVAFTAQALGAPLDTTAENIGKVINQFDLLAVQANYVGDVMVTAINESALNTDSFATAMQYIGPIARNLGLNLEQTAGAMAVLADNGFTASRIGTGLRGIFTELGKTSADVEKSLKSLAEQNISLSEAVDLVGKRNAAQLITLLENVEVIEKTNHAYYEQGRALKSASLQASNWKGQQDILISNFRQWQIEIGKTIAQSDALIRVMDVLFPKGGETSRAFRFLSTADQKTLSEVIDDIAKGGNTLEAIAKLQGKSVEQLEKDIAKVAKARASAYPTWVSQRIQDEVNLVEGLTKVLNEQADARRDNLAVESGQLEVNEIFGASVESLVEKHEKGIDVNKEADKLYKDLAHSIKSYEAGINSANGVTEEQRLQMEASIKELERLSAMVTNTTITEEERESKRQDAVKKERSDLNERIKLIKQNTKDEIEAINDAAKVADLGAKSAEERARIEEQRQQDVSAAYDKEANSIGVLSASYQENIDYIEEMAIKSDKLAEILNGDVVQDADKALKEYNKEFKELSDQYKDGEISLSEYTSATDDLRESYDDYIDTLIENNNLSEEAIDVLNYFRESFSLMSLVVRDKSLEASQSIEEFLNKLKDPENLRDFIKGYAEQFADSTTQVLQEFNDTQLENTKNSLESQLEEVKNRYEVEEDILRSSLDNQLITENQYRAKQKELRQAQLRDENDLNKQIFEAEQRQEKNDIRINTAAAIAEAVINAYTTYANPLVASAVAAGYSAIIGAQGALQISAVNQREFFPVRFAEGGLVNGPSHEQGGVPFTVQGQGGYEMEGGEFIVNREATARNYDLLRRINDSTKRTPTMGSMKFANGGLIGMQTQESVDYLKAIAEATMTTAISSSKPVRAYVTQKDLRSNENERRLKDRNDRL